VRWNLDLEKNIGTPTKAYDHLKNLSIPLKPFLGCVGIAPDGKKGISTSDSGPFGGNMDYNRVTESATVYLPVFHDGALLFMGDGHAVQGDGELNGDALETSMNFEFTVQVIKKDLSLHFPIIEDREYFMIFGIEKNLDKAMKTATLDLLAWLQKNYQLSFQEASQVIGPSVEYTIAKIAATKVEVVAKIRKEILMDLKE
jgi:acetamidase/formamidase